MDIFYVNSSVNSAAVVIYGLVDVLKYFANKVFKKLPIETIEELLSLMN